MESPRIVTILLLFFANLSVLGSSLAHDHKTNDFVECLTIQFGNSNTTISDNAIYTPGNASYESLLLAPNLRPGSSASTNRPILIITPFHQSQIQAAIHCSKKLDVQIRIRSGGHDYEALSSTSTSGIPPFIVMDMKNIRSISINTEENTAWVQSGATLGELYHAIARKSRVLAFPAGTAPSVGVGGHFSGGGYGMMSRKHALASDHIIDAELINADGQLLDRESMPEDLFWAIRGGGGTSFGIVVAFKVELVIVPETVTVFNVSRTLERSATQLVHKWQYVADKIDDNLLMRLFLSSVGSKTGNRTIEASFTSLFLGRVRDLMPVMREKFPELGLVEQDCTEMSWIESVLFFAGYHDQDQSLDVLLSRAPQYRVHFKGKSDYVRQPIPVHGLRGIWKFLNEEDGISGTGLQFSPYGGALSNISENETPFPHRSGNLFMIEYGVLWNKSGTVESEKHISWIRRLYSYMAPYVSKSPRAAYWNYRDLDIGRNNDEGDTSYQQASIWGFKYFKNNFDRLVDVKTKVDPTNFFRNEQSIPPLLGRARPYADG